MHMMHIIHMSTVVRFGRARVMVRTDDHAPAHVHVVIPGIREFRVRLDTLTLMDDTDLSPAALSDVLKLIETNREDCLAKWEEYHGKDEV